MCSFCCAATWTCEVEELLQSEVGYGVPRAGGLVSWRANRLQRSRERERERRRADEQRRQDRPIDTEQATVRPEPNTPVPTERARRSGDGTHGTSGL